MSVTNSTNALSNSTDIFDRLWNENEEKYKSAGCDIEKGPLDEVAQARFKKSTEDFLNEKTILLIGEVDRIEEGIINSVSEAKKLVNDAQMLEMEYKNNIKKLKSDIKDTKLVECRQIIQEEMPFLIEQRNEYIKTKETAKNALKNISAELQHWKSEIYDRKRKVILFKLIPSRYELERLESIPNPTPELKAEIEHKWLIYRRKYVALLREERIRNRVKS